ITMKNAEALVIDAATPEFSDGGHSQERLNFLRDHGDDPRPPSWERVFCGGEDLQILEDGMVERETLPQPARSACERWAVEALCDRGGTEGSVGECCVVQCVHRCTPFVQTQERTSLCAPLWVAGSHRRM